MGSGETGGASGTKLRGTHAHIHTHTHIYAHACAFTDAHTHTSECSVQDTGLSKLILADLNGRGHTWRCHRFGEKNAANPRSDPV